MEEVIERKALLTPAVGSEDGTVKAVFCTFGVVDRYGEVIDAGAIKGGAKVAMVWHHRWSEPVGRGVVRVTKKEAIFEGAFFLDTLAGQEAYKTVKAMDDLQQWSFGFRTIKATFEQIDDEWIRHIAELELFEVSPVLIGAGVNTHTVDVKSHGLPMADHIAATRDAVAECVARVKSLAALRGESGRRLGKESRALLKELHEALAAGAGDIDTLLADEKALQTEFLRFQKIVAAL